MLQNSAAALMEANSGRHPTKLGFGIMIEYMVLVVMV
jgi:hypothetical protein